MRRTRASGKAKSFVGMAFLRRRGELVEKPRVVPNEGEMEKEKNAQNENPDKPGVPQEGGCNVGVKSKNTLANKLLKQKGASRGNYDSRGSFLGTDIGEGETKLRANKSGGPPKEVISG